MTFRCTSSEGLNQTLDAHDIYAAVLAFLEQSEDPSRTYRIQGNRAVIKTKEPSSQIVISPVSYTSPQNV